jgi:hypothetical protein
MPEAPNIEQLQGIVSDQLNNILNGPASYNNDGTAKSLGEISNNVRGLIDTVKDLQNTAPYSRSLSTYCKLL